MASIDAVKLLRRRSRSFAIYAARALEDGDSDLACFLAEQAIQLRLKSLILRVLGYIPRTHGVRELLGVLVKFLREAGKLDEANRLNTIAKEFREGLRLVEESYTSARYLARPFTRDEAEQVFKSMDSLLKTLRN